MKIEKYFNRDKSWLSFNERVLLEAKDRSVPLYERIKFLAIYSSNLDEFFRVRVALIKRLVELNKEKLNAKVNLEAPENILNNIISIVNKQQTLFGHIFKNSILSDLKKNNIHLYYSEKYKAKHLAFIEELFYSNILSYIQPIITPKKSKSSIFLDDRKLYIISDLAKNGVNYIGIINIPSNKIDRFQMLPKINGTYYFTFIDDIIKHFSFVIFPGFKVINNTNVKLNRDAELFLDEEYSEDISVSIKKSLKKRTTGTPSRLLYEPGINKNTFEVLKQNLGLKDDDCISGGEYHNMNDLFSLPNPVGLKLENKPMPPLAHPAFRNTTSIFNAINKNDIFLSFPYQKYDYILRLFNEAAIDPKVISIKATLYRVAKDSHITNALISAARNGKHVSILVEAKARFDEENNLLWAERMKEAGVQIKYSIKSIKVHSKVALITLLSAKKEIKKYAFLGTGNFNEKTAGTYTDYALLTKDPALTNELDKVLEFTLGNKSKIKLNHLIVAQVNMRSQFIKLIDQEIRAVKKGEKGHVFIKLNNLQDEKMIDKLYLAADKGVKIDLIIRGICCLIPRKNIRVIRIVDRFLEHARVYIFRNNGNENIYIGSADWMGRNLNDRIEVVFPIYNKKIKSHIKHNIKLQLTDNTKAVTINDQLENVKGKSKSKKIRSQYNYYQYLKNNKANQK
jgi:polyphosphate kinase